MSTLTEYTFSGWLILTPPRHAHHEGTLRLTKKEPALASGERACKVQLVAPKALFKTPQLSASISFDGQGPEIDPVELSARVEDTLRAADFRVQVVPQDDGDAA